MEFECGSLYLSQKSMCRLGCPLGCSVPVLWVDECISVCMGKKPVLLSMSPSRWEHCQGKPIFKPNSFDNAPLSVFFPLVRMKELGQSL